MAKSEEYRLVKDTRGVKWDIMLYFPMVVGLGLGAAIFWHQANQGLTYLLFFLACFFFYQGLHRVLGRLIMLPGNPTVVDVSKRAVTLSLKNGQKIELIKNLRFYSEAKTIALTGMDSGGARRQYIFHKGQFEDESQFKKASAALRIFA